MLEIIVQIFLYMNLVLLPKTFLLLSLVLITVFLQGNVLTSNHTSGALCIAQPWPGMARTIHNDHQRFIETYCQPHPGTVWCVPEKTVSVIVVFLKYIFWVKTKTFYFRVFVKFKVPFSLCQQVTSLLVMAPIALRRGITRSLAAWMMSSMWAVTGLGQQR